MQGGGSITNETSLVTRSVVKGGLGWGSVVEGGTWEPSRNVSAQNLR